jgi:large subunit ribosomal protein L29
VTPLAPPAGYTSNSYKPMKASEIRDLSLDEIRERIREEEQELQNKRFQHAIAGLENPVSDLRNRRRRIARLRTILVQKEGQA